MALMRTRSQLGVSAPPPSPIPTGKGSRSAANDVLNEYIEKLVQIPELTLPDSYSGGISGTRHPIPAEIDFRLLASRRKESVDRMLRSAREFGAFRIGCHGVCSEELRSLVREAGRVFGVLEERDTGFRRNYGGGNREEIVWVRSWKERMEWAREYIGPARYRCFSQEMENIADKLEEIAGKLGQIIMENTSKKYGKRILRGESILSIYRYNHNNVMEQSPPLPKEKDDESLDFTLSLHLPAKNCEFRIQSDNGPLSFHADPDTILVTFGRQLEEWSLGEFKCVPGEIIYEPDVYGSRTSFSVKLKCCSLNLSNTDNSTRRKTFSVSDQVLIGVILIMFYQILRFVFL